MNISTASITTNETVMTFEALDKAMKDLQKMRAPLPGWKFLRYEFVPFGKVWPVKRVFNSLGVETFHPCEMNKADYLMISTETLNHYTKGGDV